MFDEMNNIDKKQYWLIILIITNVISLGIIIYLLTSRKIPKVNPKQMIVVEITGAVNNPDVYEIENDARLGDLIDLAGGYTSDVNEDSVNRATLLQDGKKYVIYSVNDNGDRTCKVNINTANLEELMELNGIGEVIGQKIIDYRDEYGSFSSIEEIMNVDGISNGRFDNIKDDICCY